MKLPSRTILYGLGGLTLAWLVLRSGDSKPMPAPPQPPPAPPTPSGLPHGQATSGTALTAHLSDKFFADVARAAQDFQAKGAKATGEDILAVLLAESGVRPRTNRPDGANSLGYAGLNQMGAGERKSVGFTGSLTDYTALSAEQQFPYVRRFFETRVEGPGHGNYALLSDYGKLYLLNIAPGLINLTNPDAVVYGPGTKEYLANTGVDTPKPGTSTKKGYIDLTDMSRFVERSVKSSSALWNELRGRLAKAQAVA